MTSVHCFTSASFAYLDRVRVLAGTIRQHHPDWDLTLCLCDREPPGFHFDPAQEPLDKVVRIDELGIPDLERWIFQHDVVELCTAVKGTMLCKLLDGGADQVIYIDPDIALFSPLEEVMAILQDHDIVLTPHILDIEQDRHAILDTEIGPLKWGIYNLGFLAVRNSAEARRFARWWRDRLHDYCIDDVPNGLFTDQAWCNHVPALFSGVHILKHPGYNVASWNLGQRRLDTDPDGRLVAAGQPLRFFHFTKVTWIGQLMLERYCSDRVEVFELLHWYRRLLDENAVIGLPECWGFDRFHSGEVIQKHHRLAYRNSPQLRDAIPHPFAAGADPFEQPLI